jgi:asparagine synthase (glutamine-hydrolysing)
MREAMRNRGPDSSGLWLSDDRLVGLAHRRLAILDLSEAGRQPMVDDATGCCIAYNGEIYNFREIRSSLEAKGHRFSSSCDTEVVLRAYIEHGESMLSMLRGMFALCVWDPRARRALIARDPLGIKPLYVAEDANGVRFASQVKALLAGGGVRDLRPDPAARAGFLMWGNIPEPHTLYRGIRAVAPGTCVWVDQGRMRTPRTYFNVVEEIACGESRAGPALEPEGAPSGLREALARSVACHLVSDVPVGVFLSAGVDSTAIASLVRETLPAEQVRTLTVAFDEYRGKDYDESVLADQIAGIIGTTHQTVRVGRSDFDDHVDRVLDAMDQPTIEGFNTYFVVRAARQAGLKVVLSGVGGDELFAGYPYYRRIPALMRWAGAPAALGVGKSLRQMGSALAEVLGNPKTASIVEMSVDTATSYLLCRSLMLPWELPKVMDPEEARIGLAELDVFEALRRSIRGIRDVSLQICALDHQWYLRNQLLRDSDWASMAHSVELRTPLVDAWLLRDIMRLRAAGLRATKSHVSACVNPHVHQVLKNRPKTGFSIPVTQWMPRELRDRAGRTNPYRQWAGYVLDRAMRHPVAPPPTVAASP